MSAIVLKSFADLGSVLVRSSVFGRGLNKYPNVTVLNSKPKRKGGLYDVSFTSTFDKVVVTNKAYILFKNKDDTRPTCILPKFDGIKIKSYGTRTHHGKAAKAVVIMTETSITMPCGLAVAKGIV